MRWNYIKRRYWISNDFQLNVTQLGKQWNFRRPLHPPPLFGGRVWRGGRVSHSPCIVGYRASVWGCWHDALLGSGIWELERWHTEGTLVDKAFHFWSATERLEASGSTEWRWSRSLSLFKQCCRLQCDVEVDVVAVRPEFLFVEVALSEIRRWGKAKTSLYYQIWDT